MASFEKNDVDYIVIGGMAINFHGFARNTQDIDVFVKPTEKNIDSLKKSLKDIFNDDEIDEITLKELNVYQVIRYGTENGFFLDIITQMGERFKYEDLQYDIKIIDGTKVKYADLLTMYKLKEKTYREIDQLDLKFIKSKLGK